MTRYPAQADPGYRTGLDRLRSQPLQSGFTRTHEGHMPAPRYLLVYPEGDCDAVDLLSIEGFANLDNPPRVGPDGDVDTTAVVRLPDGSTRMVLTLDLIDLDESEEF
jgi:hypothetical protein